MTLAEGAVRADAVSVRDGRLSLAVRLPWYRSLPISCLESIDVLIAGVPAAVTALDLPDFTGSLADAANSDAWWDLRDPMRVSLDVSAAPGELVPLEVDVAVRIPYIQLAPGRALVQRMALRTEATVR
jgi:hypothetical protein